ncbi:uncharacterized protein LOC116202269 [Punica granatum]|uniref:Uncharacterized protein LOC116202269 n=1 Tax=Punica granatum TaxID=22663 RepID=A0A218X8K4_PUNGR|nr:uncharacterized protein LOC116202269 [Punica granatum]XP_031389626.1 uncharacterized protein LOC116202269 [Punica granatum]OWM81263.1 hypothetical protein CDL15_Pgr007301 [Punica granatum]
MVQTLEAIKGGGGSIKVGTTGTISALMTRELESLKSAPKMPISPRNKHRTVAVSIPCKATATKRPQPRKSQDGASSSNSSITGHRCSEDYRKTKDYKNNYRVPILGAHNVTLDGTPVREKPERRGTNIVEVVDIRCGSADRAWASPITKLKKLGFSKLSESII